MRYTAYNVAAALASVPAGHAADRRGPVQVLALGVAAFAAAYLLFALTGPTIALLAVAFVLAGVGIGLVETAEHAAVAALAPTDLRGSAFGLLAATQSFGNLAASAVIGAIWTLASPTAALIFPAVAMLGALAAIARAAAAERALSHRRGRRVRPRMRGREHESVRPVRQNGLSGLRQAATRGSEAPTAASNHI